MAGSLLYAGGCTLNDAFDAEWDGRHRPERPIPSGSLTKRAVCLVGTAELTAGMILLVWLGLQAALGGMLLAAAILLYDWLHKKSPWAVLLMGWCRFQWVLTAAAATGVAALPAALLVYASALFLYVVGLSLVARRESRKPSGDRPEILEVDPARWLPLLPVALAAWLWSGKASVALAAAAVVPFIAWVKLAEWRCLRLQPVRIGTYVSRLLAGIVLLDLLFAAITWGWNAFFLVAFLPLCLLLQRKFAAT